MNEISKKIAATSLYKADTVEMYETQAQLRRILFSSNRIDGRIAKRDVALSLLTIVDINMKMIHEAVPKNAVYIEFYTHDNALKNPNSI